MAEEPATRGEKKDASVVLHYALTQQVVLDGLVVAQRARMRGLFASKMVWALGALWLLAIVGAVLLGLWVILALLVLAIPLVAFPRLLYFNASRSFVRRNVRSLRDVTARLSASGLSVTTPTGRTNSGWDRFCGYVETRHALVLLPKAVGAAVTTIPRSALVDEPTARRVRALLDRHVSEADDGSPR